MNLYHVQNDASWESAEKTCRGEFVEITLKYENASKYGLSARDTKLAWDFFLIGWVTSMKEKSKND